MRSTISSSGSDCRRGRVQLKPRSQKHQQSSVHLSSDEKERKVKWKKKRKRHKNSYVFQQALARMLFWGQQGVTQNIRKAVRHYERGAVQLEDPASMYDYGIVLLQVHTHTLSPPHRNGSGPLRQRFTFMPSNSLLCRDTESKKTSQKLSSSWRKQWIRF